MIELNQKTKSAGAKVHGDEHILSCNSCGIKLGILFETKEISKKYNKTVKYQCICKCGGDSFVFVSRNECYFIQEPTLFLKSISTVDNELFIKSVITLE